jgi:hypothetical protein
MKYATSRRWGTAVSLLILFPLSVASGQQHGKFGLDGNEKIPTLNMDLQLILPDTIILNQPFPITFNVTVNDSVYHWNDVPDKISLHLPQYCKVVEGDAVLKTVLSRGSRVSLTVKAKFTEPQYDWFEGYVSTGSYPTHPAIYRTDNHIRSRYYTVDGPPPDSIRIDSHGNRVKVYEGYDTHSLPLHPVIQKPSKPVDNAITITISKQSPQYLGEQKYYRNRTNQITFLIWDKTTGAKKKALPKTWSFDCSSCGMVLNPDSTARLDIDESRDSATVQVEINGTPYKVRFQVRSVTTVTGNFRYVTNFNDTVGGSGVYVELYYWDGNQYVLSECDITGADGYFSLLTYYDEVRLEFWSFNDHCYVPYSTSCWNGGDPWLFNILKVDFIIFDPGGVYEVDPDWTTVYSLNRAAAFNICRWIEVGAAYVEQCCGDPMQVLVRWGANCTEMGTYYNHDTIKIQSGAASGENRNEWDEDIILHEYGHRFTDAFAEIPDSIYGDHLYWAPLVNQTYVYEHKAWAEAFGYWFEGVLQDEGRYVDLKNSNDTFTVYSFERPEPDVPYYLLFGNLHQTGPSSLDPYWPGGKVEGAVVEALWDIYDIPNDANYYVNGQIWGHNNDQNRYDSWAGTAAILDVYMNYDPYPNDPHHNHPWDITEFANGWGVRGYPVTGHFQDILLAHAIETCNSCGDANGDGTIDIADAVFLVPYIFSGGPAPGDCIYPQGLGDANGDGEIDISDAVYLISYIFSGGPAPHCA